MESSICLLSQFQILSSLFIIITFSANENLNDVIEYDFVYIRSLQNSCSILLNDKAVAQLLSVISDQYHSARLSHSYLRGTRNNATLSTYYSIIAALVLYKFGENCVTQAMIYTTMPSLCY